MVTVSLSEVLEVREGVLVEPEFWSILTQAAFTYQDHLVHSHGANCRNFIVNKENIHLTPQGNIELVSEVRILPCLTEFIVRDFDIEGAFIYGLGLTLSGLLSVNDIKSIQLGSLLQSMTTENPRERLTIKKLFNLLRNNTKIIPSNYVIGQMYREVMGQDPAAYFCRSLRANSPEENLNENGYLSDDKLSESSDYYKRSKKCTKVNRAPSQLYKICVNKDVASTSLQLSFVGPEFIARSLQPSIIINSLYTGGATKEAAEACRVTIVLLGGQRLEIICNPTNSTVDDLIKIAIEYEKLVDNYIFGLCIIDAKSEIYFLDRSTKLFRITSGMHYEKAHNIVNFTIYFRFKYYPDLSQSSNFNIKKEVFEHLYYLQLRRDWIDGRIMALDDNAINADMICKIASLALQAEFGNTVNDYNSDYYLTEHYFPSSVSKKWGTKRLINLSKYKHQQLNHLCQYEAEVNFISELESSNLSWNSYKYVFDQVKWEEKHTNSILALSINGINLCHNPNKYIRWKDCHNNILLNKKTISIVSKDNGRVSLTCDKMKSKYLWKYMKELQKMSCHVNFNNTGPISNNPNNGEIVEMGSHKIRKKRISTLEIFSKFKNYTQIKSLVSRSHTELESLRCKDQQIIELSDSEALHINNIPIALEINIPEEDKSISLNIEETISDSLQKKMEKMDSSYLQHVVLRRGENESWGLLLSEGSDSRIYIQGLNSNGVAASDGSLKIGDCIVCINNLRIGNINFSKLVDYLKSTDEIAITYERLFFDECDE